MELSVNHLLGIKYITEDDIQLIFNTADHFKEVINRPIKKVPSLRDITIANLFFENSTRTKLSFELAEKRLSADVINFSSSSSSVAKGETLIDTVNNILSMKVDMVVMRHPNPGARIFLSKYVDASIVNAGDGAHEHPTQALLDAYSIREKLGDVAGKKVVIIGDILHSRVALSNIFALQKLGAEVQVCGPKTLIPKHIEKLGVGVETNLLKALAWCDVANMLRVQSERMDISYFPTTREYTQQFGLNRKILDSLDKEIVVMHPGPINRGVEMTSDVADSKQSIILEQVETVSPLEWQSSIYWPQKLNIMKIENHPNFVVLTDDRDDIEDFASFIAKQIPTNYQGQNVVLDLLKYEELKLAELLLFLETSNAHRKEKNSFVIVNHGINVDDIPMEMVVVPTVQEAGDIIEMEDIERDLGF